MNQVVDRGGVIEGFQTEYCGEGMQLFETYLSNAEARPRHEIYSREIVVVQSSGIGKSRMMTEATCYNLGILLNVRSEKGTFLFFLSTF